MKLQRLWIEKFGNLSHVDILFGHDATHETNADAHTHKLDYFSDSSLTKTIIIGENGTGKSTLLEVLIRIFRSLDLGESTAFSYRIEYSCQDKNIAIVSQANQPTEYFVNNSRMNPSEFLSAGGKAKHLPSYVFAYYSGSGQRFQSLFYDHDKRYYQQYLLKYEDLSEEKQKESNFRRLFYAQTIHGQFALLSFLAKPSDNSQTILNEEFGITEIDSVLFVLRKPHWARSGATAKGAEYERFWGARGLVRVFLEALYNYALAPVSSKGVRIKKDFSHDETKELLYLYFPNVDFLRSILSDRFNTQQDLFQALESTYVSDLIEDIKISLKTKFSTQPIFYSDLSEGEKQLLTVFGLLRFTQKENSIILLDEPDTHINPVWSWKYFEMLERAVGTQNRTHLIMVSHDPLVVSELSKNEVVVLQREAEGQIKASQPTNDPRGQGVSGVLTSELFGLRSALDQTTLKLLDRKRGLSIKNTLTIEEREELRKLDELTRDLPFTREDDDPEYRLFLKALFREKQYEELRSKDSLNQGDITDLMELAEAALSKGKVN